MATVQIDGVHKRYGDTPVIHGVDIDIADGEFVILVGPSGCGKSTLLRMVAGLEDISGGEVRIGERVVNDLTPTERDIAMVFQNYALYPHMTVAQNMSFALRLQRVPKAEIDARVNRAANILALEPLLQRLPGALSGGQRQRVAMGRAIVRDPQVFLFDEPLSNLDAKLRVQMRGEIKALHQRLATTTLYVTHDQVEAMTMGEKIVVLNEGRVEQAGPPLALYDRPANLFVAGFIGSPAMNLLPGPGAGRALRHRARHGAGARRRPRPLPEGVAVFGIRPEHLQLDDDAGVPATVRVVEPTGAQTQVELDLGGPCDHGHLPRPPQTPAPATRCTCGRSRARAHLFDAASGLRLN